MGIQRQIIATVIAGVITVLVVEVLLRPRLPKLVESLDAVISGPLVVTG